MSDQPPPDPAYAGQAPTYGAPPPSYPPPVYPQQPYGPPQYDATQYGATPYGAPQYGHPQWPGGGYPAAPAPGPSGVTAIIAGVLAILIGLYQGFQAIMYVIVASVTTPMMAEVDMGDVDWLSGYLVALAIGSVFSALMLLVAGGFIFGRRSWARWVIAAGCVMAIIVSVSPVLLADSWLRSLPEDAGVDYFYDGMGPFTIFMMVLWIGIPLITAVLALLPATRRYCGFRRG